jgi:hypothetical protein
MEILKRYNFTFTKKIINLRLINNSEFIYERKLVI